MKKILHIISSPRGSASFSVQLGNAIVQKIQSEYNHSSVRELHLAGNQFPHLEETHMTSFFTPPENRTAEHSSLAQHSEEAIQNILDADIMIIGVPVYNFQIHSALKAWIDNIVRAGITFKYSEAGPEGLIKGKKVYLAIASGAVYSEEPMRSMDFVEPYLKTILGFIGLTDISVFRVEGTAIPELKDTALEKAIRSIQLSQPATAPVIA